MQPNPLHGWQGRKVFLTGHTGFKGAWLALWLLRLGANVHGYALPPAAGHSLHELCRLGEDIPGTISDIRDRDALQAALAQSDPDVVFHLAAQPLVRASYEAPIDTFEVNVMGTANLLEAVRQHAAAHPGRRRAVLIITTDKCYENREWHWSYREIDNLGGHDPYSASKACAELATAAYRQSFFPGSRYGDHLTAVASARAGNVIGGGDWSTDRLIPDLVRGFNQGQFPAIRSPHAIRPWQHVLEPLSGYLALADRLLGEDGDQYAEAWNFGPDEASNRPVSWIVQRMLGLWGADAAASPATAAKPLLHEAGALKLDSSKAKERLGWLPRWTLGDALERIVAWNGAFLAGADMRDFCLGELQAYENTIAQP